MADMGMRIEGLAVAAGVSTRNIRAYQSLGLLGPPALSGRVGFYGEAHLDRLRAISRLHAQGFSLAAIRSLFEAQERGHTLEDVLGSRPRPQERSPDHDRDAFDELAESLTSWRGKPAALLPSSFVSTYLSTN